MSDKLLIGTVDRLISWSRTEGEIVLHRGKGVYCGATWDARQVYILCRGHGARGRSTLEKLHVFTPSFKHTGAGGIIGDSKLAETHCAYFWDGMVLIVNTGQNTICGWNPETGLEKVWPWRGVQGRDGHHINGIWNDGRIMYVVEHNHAGQRLGRNESHIYTWEPGTGAKKVYSGGCQLHDVVVSDGFLYTCSSYDSRVLKIDMKTKKVVAKYDTGIQFYPRGMAKHGGNIWVGLSYRRADRRLRDGGPSAIVRIDENMRFCEIKKFRYTGQISFVRLMNKPDEAHNRLLFPEA